MRFRDNRVTMVKDEMPSPDTVEQMMGTDLDVRASVRMVAPKPGSKDRFRSQHNRSSLREQRGSQGRKRLGGVALTEKPWSKTSSTATGGFKPLGMLAE